MDSKQIFRRLKEDIYVRTQKIWVLGFELHQKYNISIFYFYSSLSLGLKSMRKVPSLLSNLAKGSMSFEGDRKLYFLQRGF